MAETYPSESALQAMLGGLYKGLPMGTLGDTPWHCDAKRDWWVATAIHAICDNCRVWKDGAGALKFGVSPGRFRSGSGVVAFAGAAAQNLTDNAVNYIYLLDDGTLVVNTTGWPVNTRYVPLATIAVGTASSGGVSGAYDFADMTDMRGAAMMAAIGVT
ncbi:MAG: hypothetical protein ACE15C_14455 [Phycisphaerae bacterium]